ncbi:hypothetical protein [Paenibacillus pinihumi]|uniref:hypothetical protein n=1 Tax=Paenibacillus pinihumi TaxID=669462 RepID=UPI0003FC64E0|nr:hypothetical protein [Paenibacillus pinihumi]
MNEKKEQIYFPHDKAYKQLLSSKRIFIDLLHYKYLLTDIHGFDEQQLEELSNLIGVIFLLERKPEVHAFMKEMKRLANVLEKLPTGLFRIFKHWIKIATNRGLTDACKYPVNEIIDQFTDPKEIRNMICKLEKAFEKIECDAEMKGIRQFPSPH